MSELKVYLSTSLNEKFRRIAMGVYGYGKGSLSKAAEDAFSKWCEQNEPKTVTDVKGSAQPGNGIRDSETSHDPEERHLDPPKQEAHADRVEKSQSQDISNSPPA